MTWNNGYLIFLKIKDLFSLENLIEKLEVDGKKFSIFREPDLDHEITAIACLSERDSSFKKLKLL